MATMRQIQDFFQIIFQYIFVSLNYDLKKSRICHIQGQICPTLEANLNMAVLSSSPQIDVAITHKSELINVSINHQNICEYKSPECVCRVQFVTLLYLCVCVCICLNYVVCGNVYNCGDHLLLCVYASVQLSVSRYMLYVQFYNENEIIRHPLSRPDQTWFRL